MATHDSNIIGAADAAARLPELLELVRGGEEITITSSGSPVARLVPV
ncbi:MAG TPA: type II toxin-antitoxin system prevent-host-death family antitoxin [Pirellulales bacterium]|nr:type II toxin-antitoxin system prevent-host-death family antitoxin [Pirellulales bacterium]